MRSEPFEPNPYQSPESDEAAASLYEVTPFLPFMRKSTDILCKQIEERAAHGWRLVTSWEVTIRYLVWTRTRSPQSGGNGVPRYSVRSLPSLSECLRRRSFSPWSSTIADEFAKLPAGCVVDTFCSTAGYVLRHKPHSADTDREVYAVLCQPAEWRRTLFGFSWIPRLSESLNTGCGPESEIIAYLGNDLFLTRKRPAREKTASTNDQCERGTYRLAMWPNWKRLSVSGAPSIVPWLDDEASRGWELLSHYSGAVFLFKKQSSRFSSAT